jgi:hypothetical protein
LHRTAIKANTGSAQISLLYRYGTCYIAAIMERDLWIAVVSTAHEDIETGHYRSVDYSQSVSFFTEPTGTWAEWRTRVAEMIDLHGDDLKRLGERAITAREASEALMPREHGKHAPPDRLAQIRRFLQRETARQQERHDDGAH